MLILGLYVERIVFNKKAGNVLDKVLVSGCIVSFIFSVLNNLNNSVPLTCTKSDITYSSFITMHDTPNTHGIPKKVKLILDNDSVYSDKPFSEQQLKDNVDRKVQLITGLLDLQMGNYTVSYSDYLQVCNPNTRDFTSIILSAMSFVGGVLGTFSPIFNGILQIIEDRTIDLLLTRWVNDDKLTDIETVYLRQNQKFNYTYIEMAKNPRRKKPSFEMIREFFKVNKTIDNLNKIVPHLEGTPANLPLHEIQVPVEPEDSVPGRVFL